MKLVKQLFNVTNIFQEVWTEGVTWNEEYQYLFPFFLSSLLSIFCLICFLRTAFWLDNTFTDKQSQQNLKSLYQFTNYAGKRSKYLENVDTLALSISVLSWFYLDLTVVNPVDLIV